MKICGSLVKQLLRENYITFICLNLKRRFKINNLNFPFMRKFNTKPKISRSEEIINVRTEVIK